MKKYNLWILLLTLAVSACTQEFPTQLSYKDIYGYDYSAKVPVSNGSFFIKKATNMTFQESNVTDSTATYIITTSGVDPNFTTARIGGVIDPAACVFTCKYKTTKTISPIINLDITKATAAANMGTMDVSSEWKEYTWDLGTAQGLIATNAWGGIGSYFKLTLKIVNPTVPASIELKDIKFRKRNVQEEAIVNTGLWLTLTSKDGGDISNFQDITATEGGYNLITRNVYSYKILKNTNFIRTLPLARAFLPGEQNHLKFEYKCDIQTALVFFVNVPNFVGPTAISQLPASSGWSTIDYDFTGEVNFPQSSYTANPLQLSFYYPGAETPTIYIRGMHFYIK
ncbi:MAG: hypothetical protein ACOYMD_14755 [Paludibacter sp.]